MAFPTSWLVYRSGIFVIMGGTVADVLFVTFVFSVRSCLNSDRRNGGTNHAHSQQDVRLLVLSLAVSISSLALTVCLAVTALISTTDTADCRGFAVANKTLLAVLSSLSSYYLIRLATCTVNSSSRDQESKQRDRSSNLQGRASWPETNDTRDERVTSALDSPHETKKSITVFTFALYAALVLEGVGWLAWICTTREDYALVKLKEGGTFCMVYLHSKLLPFAFACNLLPSLMVMISPIYYLGNQRNWRPLLPTSIGGLLSFVSRGIALVSMLCTGIYGPQQLAMIAAFCFAASASRFSTLLGQFAFDGIPSEQREQSGHHFSDYRDPNMEKQDHFFVPRSSIRQAQHASLPDLEKGMNCFSRPATALSWGGIKPTWSPIHPLQSQSRSGHHVKPSVGIPQDVSSPSTASYKILYDANSIQTPDTPREQWYETCSPGDAFPSKASPRPAHVACNVESHDFGRFLANSIDLQQSSTGEGDAFYRQRTKSDSILLDREPPKRKSVPVLGDDHSMAIQASRKPLDSDKETLSISMTPTLAKMSNKDEDDRSIYSKQSAFAESAVIDYLQRYEALGVRSSTTSIQPGTIQDTREARVSLQSSRGASQPRRRQASVGSNLIFECKPSRLSVESQMPDERQKSFLEEHNLALERPQSKLSIRRLLRTPTLRKTPNPSGPPCEATLP